MKLASLKHQNRRDGLLCVVSRDLTRACPVPHIVDSLQKALDDWAIYAPQLNRVYEALNQGMSQAVIPFNTSHCHAPLPRAYQWADGSAYVNHVELVRKARGAEMPADFWTNPLMYQGGSDDFLGPMDDIIVSDLAYGVDFEAEVAVITHDVPMNVAVSEANQYIALLMLVNDVSLRNLIPGELAKGFGFFQSKPSSSFSPVAITPDELGEAWHDGRVQLPLVTSLNHQRFGHPNAGVDMTFSFNELIAHAAKTRRLRAGSIIGSGTVSNLDRSLGSSCIAEKRTLEFIEHGQALTPFMQYGDQVKIEMFDAQGESIFGAIDQKLTAEGM